MTQIRPRIDDERLVAQIQDFADRYSEEIKVRVSFNAAVMILIRAGLEATERQSASAEVRARLLAAGFPVITQEEEKP